MKRTGGPGATAAAPQEEMVGAFKTTGDVDAEAPMEDECVICFEELKGGVSRATLSGCSHTCFCYDCIMAWSKTENRCPVCRTRFVSLTRIDGESSRGSEGKGKGKRAKASPTVVKIQTRDQASTAAAARASSQFNTLFDPLGHDFLFEWTPRGFAPVPPAGPHRGGPGGVPGPEWIGRRGAGGGGEHPAYAQRRVTMQPLDFYMPDFAGLQDLARGMGSRPGGGGGAAAAPGSSNRNAEAHSESGPSSTAPARRQVEHVIEFSQRIRYSASTARAGRSSGPSSSSMAQGAAASAASSSSASGSSSSGNSRRNPTGRSASSRPSSAMAGTAQDPVILDDTESDDSEVALMEGRGAPPMRLGQEAFQDFQSFLLETAPMLDGRDDMDFFPLFLPEVEWVRRQPHRLPQHLHLHNRAPRGGTNPTSRGQATAPVGASSRRRSAPEVIVLSDDDDDEVVMNRPTAASSSTAGGSAFAVGRSEAATSVRSPSGEASARSTHKRRRRR